MSRSHFLPLWIFGVHPIFLLAPELPTSSLQSVFPAQAAETLIILLRVKWVFLCRERLGPVWVHSQGNRGIEQHPEGLDDSLRIMGSGHTACFSYPFLSWRLFSYPSYSSRFSSNLPSMFQRGLCSSGCAIRRVASSCSSLSIVSYRQHYPVIFLRQHVWGSSKR